MTWLNSHCVGECVYVRIESKYLTFNWQVVAKYQLDITERKIIQWIWSSVKNNYWRIYETKQTYQWLQNEEKVKYIWNTLMHIPLRFFYGSSSSGCYEPIRAPSGRFDNSENGTSYTTNVKRFDQWSEINESVPFWRYRNTMYEQSVDLFTKCGLVNKV